MIPGMPVGPGRPFGITIGPLQYAWTRDAAWQFYADVADSAADTVVLGEVVCTRRHQIKSDDWWALGAELAQAGKTVVLATPTLVAGDAELRLARRWCEQDRFMVEAGDTTAIALLAQRDGSAALPWSIGPHVNVYNRPALEELAPLGAARWVPPLELALDAVKRINPPAEPVRAPSGAVVTEVFAFGRMPLAFSARCFTARHHRLRKDACEERCRADADGLLMEAADGEPFLVLNGVHAQSAALHGLIRSRDDVAAAGASRLRLSPCSGPFARVIALFDSVYNQGAEAAAAHDELATMGLPGRLVNCFAHGQPGMREAA